MPPARAAKPVRRDRAVPAARQSGGCRIQRKHVASALICFLGAGHFYDKQDYYEVLGVASDADAKAIRMPSARWP